jgi:hypothetical protein
MADTVPRSMTAVLVAAAYVAMMVATAANEAARAHAQGAFPLTDLTVPAERLPTGCSLSPSPWIRSSDNRVRTGLWAGLPISSNPWTGTDRAIVASIVERVIDPPRLPDGPPLTSRELARFRLRLADGVEEGYAAVYTDGGLSLITVNALRYSDITQLPSWRNPERVRPGSFRLTFGRTVLVVSGEDGPCLQAVGAHVKELASR